MVLWSLYQVKISLPCSLEFRDSCNICRSWFFWIKSKITWKVTGIFTLLILIHNMNPLYYYYYYRYYYNYYQLVLFLLLVVQKFLPPPKNFSTTLSLTSTLSPSSVYHLRRTVLRYFISETSHWTRLNTCWLESYSTM